MTTTEAAPTHLRENPYAIARQQLRKVGETFGIDPNLINVLENCKKSIEVSIPVTMDDGSVQRLLRLPRHRTTSRGARRRAASGTTRTSRSTRSSRSRCG